MLKGIQALFTSGILLDPFVLLGLVLGGFCYFDLSYDQITMIYLDYRFYVLSLLLAIVYHFAVRPTYHRGGFTIDTRKTVSNAVLSGLKFVMSSLLMMAFISFWSFGGDESETDYQSVENFEQQLKQ